MEVLVRVIQGSLFGVEAPIQEESLRSGMGLVSILMIVVLRVIFGRGRRGELVSERGWDLVIRAIGLPSDISPS